MDKSSNERTVGGMSTTSTCERSAGRAAQSPTSRRDSTAPSRSIFQHPFKAFVEVRGFPIRAFEADRERDELAITLDRATPRITWKRLTGKPGELDRDLRAILAARAPQ